MNHLVESPLLGTEVADIQSPAERIGDRIVVDHLAESCCVVTLEKVEPEGW